MRLVKYLWAAALSMGVVLFFCSLTSFVRVHFTHAGGSAAVNLIWGANYVLITLTMTRLAVRGRWKVYLLIIVMLATYLAWRVALCTLAESFAVALMVLIAALSLVIAVFTVKEGISGIIFFPVLLWHGAILLRLFGAL